MKKIGVVGYGTMGNGIVSVSIASGFDVVVCEVDQERVDKGNALVKKTLSKLVAKGKIEGDVDTYLSGLQTVLTLDGLKDCDIVVEAATENKTLKLDIFQKLDNILPDNVILATNTSSISITEIAGHTNRADKVIGMHFMNPVPIMKLVEVIRGIATSDETYNLVKELSEKLGKTPVEVNDYPGFVVNRLLIPMINEAVYTLMEGVAEKEAIDTVMKLGAAHPMGPLALADLIGLDVCLSIMEVLYDGFKDTKYRPCPLLVKMVRAGYLGRKTKKGFYDY
ncbi:MAG: 3-hydroxybutyryl-CoA dehydrogenase [Candidatus Muiribacterium halophilum]|uniref:3-hydroxybutyryl-CoA dehydrogenase n=1 Tax=Muiribacterium halophilum TaxID=2053465 RepID=A0A2N5ZKM0_MUIH1|nr:MAG: 3-hydroxybutyryl-CoA dehydrogenase [Candidatus Muirbacterium halophilum]